jgi:hypothetical protein
MAELEYDPLDRRLGVSYSFGAVHRERIRS